MASRNKPADKAKSKSSDGNHPLRNAALLGALAGGVFALIGSIIGVAGSAMVTDNNNDREDARRAQEVKRDAYIKLEATLDAQTVKLDKIFDLAAAAQIASDKTPLTRKQLEKQFFDERAKLGQLLVPVDADATPVHVYGAYEAVNAAADAADLMNLALEDSIYAFRGRDEFTRFRQDMVALTRARTAYLKAVRKDLRIEGRGLRYLDPDNSYANPYDE